MSEVVATLKPLFEMDLYLSRSIVACLNVFELGSVLKENWIPIEVACATLLYFMKVTRGQWDVWAGKYTYTEHEKVMCQLEY